MDHLEGALRRAQEPPPADAEQGRLLERLLAAEQLQPPCEARPTAAGEAVR